MVDYILWSVFLLFSLYLTFFSLASLLKNSKPYPKAKKQNKFAIIYPAYKEDRVILDSVNNFLEQIYPANKYKVVIVSDQMKEETVIALRQLPVQVLIANYEERNKAKALQLAVESLQSEEYDGIVILDADNHVDSDFLLKMNDLYDAGVKAVQAHRTMKNKNTKIALLDGMSEEINNSIFRKGHQNVGLSSALIGSGMMFDYNWFKDNVGKLSTTGEDKEIELLLLIQNIFIEYRNDIFVYDEKIQNTANFSKQRRRWLSAQFFSLKKAALLFPFAIKSKNVNLLDKIFQWMMLPRIIIVGITSLMVMLSPFIDAINSFRWIFLFLLQILSLWIAIPSEIKDRNLFRAIKSVPYLFILMTFNLLKMKGVDKTFIHTEHGE